MTGTGTGGERKVPFRIEITLQTPSVMIFDF